MCLDCAVLRTQLEALEHELAGAVEGYEIESSNRRKAEREAHRLKRELNGSTNKETSKVREICEYHSDLWKKAFPKARGLSYPMDGKNAAAVRKVIRWDFKVEEIKEILDGAFASDFHRTKPQYLYLSSVLGDENKIRNHLERLNEKRAQALLDEGLKLVRETLNVRVEQPVDRVLCALEAKDLKWRAAGPFVWLSTCPLCTGVLRLDERPNGWARVACGACDWLEVLEALWLEPADLARNFIPDVPVAA